MAGPRRRPGRRAGDSGTRDAILDSARDLFAERGYEGASMRAIAARADVDSGLIRHFFGDKEGLFVATIADRSVIPARLGAALDGPPEKLGERVTDVYLKLWQDEETRPILLSLVRSAMTSEKGIELLVEAVGSRVNADEVLPRNLSITRRALVIAQLFGVAVSRNVLRLPGLAELPHEKLVQYLAPQIQRCLTEGPD